MLYPQNGDRIVTIDSATSLNSPYVLLGRIAMHSIRCGLLLTLSALRGLCNSRVSVRPSVCPVDRQQQLRAAGLLLSALRAGDMDGYLRAPAPRIPAVDQYLLQAPVLGSR